MKLNRILSKPLAILIVLIMLVSTLMVTPTLAYDEVAEEKSAELIAAEALHKLGLFLGYGDDENGNPVFGLEDGATRIQGIIMLLRFLGEYEEATKGNSACPFVDVAGEYSRAIAGFAFAKGYTKGVSATNFDPSGALSATMYLTFILRALGYEDGVDFEWNAAWALSDELGITNGEFDAANNSLRRGQMVLISLFALQQLVKDTEQSLVQKLIAAGVFRNLTMQPEEIIALVDETIAELTDTEDVIVEPDPPKVDVPPSGGSPGGSPGGPGGGPPPVTPTYPISVPGAKVGDYIELYDLKTYQFSYIEVTTAGRIVLTKEGVYAWWIVEKADIIVATGGKTTNSNFKPGHYVKLVDVRNTVHTDYLEVDANGQVAVTDGRYVYWGDSISAENVVISVSGKTISVLGALGDFIELYNLSTDEWTGYVEIGSDGRAQVPSGLYLNQGDIVLAKDVIISTGGRTTNFDGTPGDFVELWDLTNNAHAGFYQVAADKQLVVPNGKYVHMDSFLRIPAADVVISVSGKTTNLNDATPGKCVELMRLQEGGFEYFLAEVGADGQATVPSGNYYLTSTYDIVTSTGGKVTGLLGISADDFVLLVSLETLMWDYYRVNASGEAVVPDGKYLYIDWTSSDMVIVVANGVTLNFKDEHSEYKEGDYVYLWGWIENIWGYFRVGANGEASVPVDGKYGHFSDDYIPAERIVVVR